MVKRMCGSYRPLEARVKPATAELRRHCGTAPGAADKAAAGHRTQGKAYTLYALDNATFILSLFTLTDIF